MLLNKIQDTIQKYNLVKSGAKIILAVSGGPDSILLLTVFAKLRKKYNLDLSVLHINHLIRKSAARKEADFVKKLSAKLKIPFYYYEKDAPAFAKEHKLSLEEAARNIRRAVYGELLKKLGADSLATGHNSDDQAETVLMRIIRGTSPAGLGGMKPASGFIIRPLIELPRAEITAYLEKNKIKFKTDESNKDIKFFRNKIRHKLLPLLKKEYNPNIIEALITLARLAEEDEDCYSKAALALCAQSSAKNEAKTELDLRVIAGQHPALLKRIIKTAVKSRLGHAQDITNYHYEKIYELIKEQKGLKKLHMPNDLVVEKQYDKLIIKTVGADPCVRPEQRDVCPESKDVSHSFNKPVEFTVPGVYKFDGWGLELHCAVHHTVHGCGIVKEIETADTATSLVRTAYFDFDKIKTNKLALRSRKDGDYFAPSGMRGKKKIKDFFIDLKIPRDLRDKIPLITANNEIIWVVGYRTSDKYKVTRLTKRILKIEVQGIK